MKDFKVKKHSKPITDAEVEAEIERLQDSEAYRLGRLESRLKEKRRQKLYMLRMYARRGEELMKNGYTEDSLRAEYAEEIWEEC